MWTSYPALSRERDPSAGGSHLYPNLEDDDWLGWDTTQTNTCCHNRVRRKLQHETDDSRHSQLKEEETQVGAEAAEALAALWTLRWERHWRDEKLLHAARSRGDPTTALAQLTDTNGPLPGQSQGGTRPAGRTGRPADDVPALGSPLHLKPEEPSPTALFE